MPEDFAPPPPPGQPPPTGQYPTAPPQPGQYAPAPSAWAQPGTGTGWNQPPPGWGRPQQPWGQPGLPPPFPGPAAPKNSGLAVAALAFGLIGLVCSPIVILPLLGIVFGWRGLNQIKRGGGQVTGRGLAISGIVTGGLGLIAGTAIIVLAATGTWDVDELTSLTGDTSDIAVGDCLVLPGQGTVRDLDEQPCSAPHEAELIYRGSLDGSTYPGTTVTQMRVESLCSNQFETYIGTPYDASELEMLYIYPLESTWQFGDREYLCMANEPNGAQLPAGTVKGSRR